MHNKGHTASLEVNMLYPDVPPALVTFLTLGHFENDFLVHFA